MSDSKFACGFNRVGASPTRKSDRRRYRRGRSWSIVIQSSATPTVSRRDSNVILVWRHHEHIPVSNPDGREPRGARRRGRRPELWRSTVVGDDAEEPAAEHAGATGERWRYAVPDHRQERAPECAGATDESANADERRRD